MRRVRRLPRGHAQAGRLAPRHARAPTRRGDARRTAARISRAARRTLTAACCDGPDGLDELGARADAGCRRLIERAKDAGTLRTDFTAEDFVVMLMANEGLVERTGAHTPAATARLVSIVLDGLRAEAATA